jgi:DNA replication protein DnaC
MSSELAEIAGICGIPVKYRSWSPARAKEIGNVDLLLWLREREGSAWVGGTNGVGKTHAVYYCAYRRLKDRGTTCYAIRSSEWLRTVTTMRTGDSRADAEKLFKRATTTPLLIVDDLGKENLSLARAELLYDITDIRDREDLPIWITTNFDGDDLLERLNGASEHEFGHAIMKRWKRMVTENDTYDMDKGEQT